MHIQSKPIRNHFVCHKILDADEDGWESNRYKKQSRILHTTELVRQGPSQGCGVGAGAGAGVARSRGNEPRVGVGVDQTASTPTPELFVWIWDRICLWRGEFVCNFWKWYVDISSLNFVGIQYTYTYMLGAWLSKADPSWPNAAMPPKRPKMAQNRHTYTSIKEKRELLFIKTSSLLLVRSKQVKADYFSEIGVPLWNSVQPLPSSLAESTIDDLPTFRRRFNKNRCSSKGKFMTGRQVIRHVECVKNAHLWNVRKWHAICWQHTGVATGWGKGNSLPPPPTSDRRHPEIDTDTRRFRGRKKWG